MGAGLLLLSFFSFEPHKNVHRLLFVLACCSFCEFGVEQ